MEECKEVIAKTNTQTTLLSKHTALLHSRVRRKEKKKKAVNPLISLLFDYTFQMNIKVQVTYSKAYLLSEIWTMKLSASDEKQAQVCFF